jgi:hypothetical protein
MMLKISSSCPVEQEADKAKRQPGEASDQHLHD